MGEKAEQQAYIAVTSTGFVDGACFTESEDTAEWVAEMKAAGMRIDCVPRAEAKRLLFTRLPLSRNQREGCYLGSINGRHKRTHYVERSLASRLRDRAVTREEWIDRCAKRYMERGGMNEKDARAAALYQAGEQDDTWGWDGPEEAADEDMRGWTND